MVGQQLKATVLFSLFCKNEKGARQQTNPVRGKRNLLKDDIYKNNRFRLCEDI